MSKPLDFSRLEKFEKPAPSKGQGAPETAPTSLSQQAAPAARWPSREPAQEGQFTIRARIDQIERFKALCRPPGGGRFTYGELLERMMDLYEREGQGGR